MKLTNSLLKKIIMQEVAKFGAERDVEDTKAAEVDADEYGSDKALEKKIDYMKALKIEENRLRRRLLKLAEVRRRLARTL